MTALTIDRRHGRRALLLAAGAVLLALCATVVLAGAGADPADAARAKTIGKTKKTPNPSCPGSRTKDCEAVGSLTGFQVNAGGTKNPFRVTRNGRLVGWSVDLSRPKPSERRFFGKLYREKSFGTSPTARISVIQPKGKKRYTLKHQSPVADLAEHLGQKPIFTLGNPLSVRKGDIVALTAPTWISAFGVQLPTGSNSWRASRSSSACEVGTEGELLRNLKKSKPQEQAGSTRKYACLYRGARLLYWGYFVSS